MTTKFKAKCERVRANNGVVEVLFIRTADVFDNEGHDEIFLFNLKVPFDRYEVGREYWLNHPEPAFPH